MLLDCISWNDISCLLDCIIVVLVNKGNKVLVDIHLDIDHIPFSYLQGVRHLLVHKALTDIHSVKSIPVAKFNRSFLVCVPEHHTSLVVVLNNFVGHFITVRKLDSWCKFFVS